MITVDKEKLREYVNGVLADDDGKPLTDDELNTCANCLIQAADSLGFDYLWDTLNDLRDKHDI